jgi:hypothetical protein
MYVCALTLDFMASSVLLCLADILAGAKAAHMAKRAAMTRNLNIFD